MEIRIIEVGSQEFSFSRAEVVDDCYFVLQKQSFHEVAADEASATRDEDGLILKHRSHGILFRVIKIVDPCEALPPYLVMICALSIKVESIHNHLIRSYAWC